MDQVITTGRDLTSRVSDVLGLKYITDVQIKTSVESHAEITVTVLLTTEQEKQLLGKE